MMRTNNFFCKLTILIILLVLNCQFVFADDWIISAMKFSNDQKNKTKVADGICEVLPQKILENIQLLSTRNIFQDEQSARKLYELKNQRISLFLQLSALIKTRDSYVATENNQKELQNKIAQQNQKIDDLLKQIDENLETQNKIYKGLYEEPQEYSDFLSKVFLSKSESDDVEKISIYNNDSTVLFEASEKLKNASLDSYEFEKQVCSSKINSLITGKVTVYGDYFVVYVQVYEYPGAKEIASYKEYGNLDELEDAALGIYLAIREQITNSLPVVIKIPQMDENTQLYIDNSLQKLQPEYSIESGVHTLEFRQEGFNPVKTSYYFEGNKTYDIQLNLEEKVNKQGFITVLPSVPGSLYADGIEIAKNEEEKFPIVINNQKILAQFITEENNNSFFFYIQENNGLNLENYSVKVKPMNTSDYIEKRRRWMYTSYSILVTSLIPTFYIQGQVNSYQTAYAAGYLKSQQDLETANNWLIASNVSTGVTIGCGVWFVYELIRYLYAANSVLPSEAKPEK